MNCWRFLRNMEKAVLVTMKVLTIDSLGSFSKFCDSVMSSSLFSSKSESEFAPSDCVSLPSASFSLSSLRKLAGRRKVLSSTLAVWDIGVDSARYRSTAFEELIL